MSNIQTDMTSNEKQAPPANSAPWFHSLKLKAVMFVLLLLADTVFFTMVAMQGRQQPLEKIEAYQQIQLAEKALIQADIAVFHVITIMLIEVDEQGMDSVVNYFASLRENYLQLERVFPDQAQPFRELVELLPTVVANPAPDTLNQLTRLITQSKMNLDRLMDLNRDRRQQLVEDLRLQSDRVMREAMALGAIGLALFGTVTGLFFAGLTKNLSRLRTRVQQIVDGYRGKELQTERRDELGQLIRGVNQMASTLLEREQELEIERRKSSFNEKMVAVEALAGGVAHEIINPITCIVGLAQTARDSLTGQEKIPNALAENLASIESYSQTLADVTRDLSIIATHSDTARQLMDINQLISDSCNLLRYDPRWEGVQFEFKLAHMLPAVSGIPDQLSLVISNIMENAFDALAENTNETATVTIETRLINDNQILCRFTDNGCGMDKEMLAHALEPFYSTKPVGSGTGLGLALCWSIVASHGGSLQLHSNPDEGTTVEITLSAHGMEQNG